MKPGKMTFTSRQRMILSLLVVAPALRYGREQGDVSREPNETQSPREPAEDQKVV